MRKRAQPVFFVFVLFLPLLDDWNLHQKPAPWTSRGSAKQKTEEPLLFVVANPDPAGPQSQLLSDLHDIFLTGYKNSKVVLIFMRMLKMSVLGLFFLSVGFFQQTNEAIQF